MPNPYSLVLNKEWVHIMDRYSSLFNIIKNKEESDEEKSSDGNTYPFEKDQNLRESTYKDTPKMNFSF